MTWTANPDQVLGDFTPIPAGWYPGSIVEMEYKPKKDKPDEGYLQLTVEIDEGDHKGRQLFDNLNMWDQSEKAQQYVQRKVNTLCMSTGQHQITDLNQLMNNRLLIQVKLREAREVVDENTGETKKYDAQNQISNYKAIPTGGAATPPATQAQPTQPPQTQSAPAQSGPPATPTPPPAQQTAPAQPPAQTQAQAAPAQTPPPAAATGSVPPWLQGK